MIENINQKIEVLSEFDTTIPGTWEKGTMVNVAVVPGPQSENYIPQLVLAKEGEDLIYTEGKSYESFNIYKEMVGLTIDKTLNQSTDNADLKLSGTSNGYRIIEFDLTKVKKYGASSVTWNVASNYPTNKFEVSYNNGTSWTVLTKGGSLNYTKNQDLTGKKILIKYTATYNASQMPVLQDFSLTVISAYKTSGHWISPNFPLSDIKTLLDWEPDEQYRKYSYPSQTTAPIDISYDDGKTWVRKPEYYEDIVVNGTTNKFIKVRFNLTTNDTLVTPSFAFLKLKYWSEINPYSLKIKETKKDKIKQIDFSVYSTKNDPTHILLTNESSYYKRVRITQSAGSFNKNILAIIVSKPRKVVVLDKEQIKVKCFDINYIATQYIFNDVYPKAGYYDHNYFAATSWDRIIIDVWRRYGPKWLFIEYDSPPTLTGTIITGKIQRCDVPVSSIGSNFGTLYDFMEKVKNMTGYDWNINSNNELEFFKPTTKVTNITLKSDVNIIKTPNIDNDIPEIVNVVVVPIVNKKPNFEEILDIQSGVRKYSLGYKVVVTEFFADGKLVTIDPPPKVYRLENGNYVELVTYEDGMTPYAEQGKPEPPAAQAYYNISTGTIELVDKPASNVNNGLKVIYTTQYAGTIERRDVESIKLFGEKYYYMRADGLSRNEAVTVADNYLLERSFPIQPIVVNTTEFKMNLGDYVRVVLPEQNIDQLMPIVMIEVETVNVNTTISVTLNKAPLDDVDLILDLFSRIDKLEKESLANVVPLEKFYTIEDSISVTDSIVWKLG